MTNYYLIAKIKEFFSTEGYVSLISFSDFPDRFFALNKVYIDVYGEKKEFIVEKIRKRKKEYLIKFKNFNCDKDLQFLVGKEIYVDEEHLIIPEKDTYFVHDLIGSKVFKDSKFFGYLIDVMSLPANDVYVIKDLQDKEVLVPAVKEFIRRIDVHEKKMELAPGSELLYHDQD